MLNKEKFLEKLSCISTFKVIGIKNPTKLGNEVIFGLKNKIAIVNVRRSHGDIVEGKVVEFSTIDNSPKLPVSITSSLVSSIKNHPEDFLFIRFRENFNELGQYSQHFSGTGENVSNTPSIARSCSDGGFLSDLKKVSTFELKKSTFTFPK
jgi:hypothetical protein